MKKSLCFLVLVVGAVIVAPILSFAADPGKVTSGVRHELPLTESQIREIRKAAEGIERARNSHPSKLFNRVIKVNSEPGSVYPVVYLSLGFITTIRVVDDFGSPWPIEMSFAGDKNLVNVVKGESKGKTNIAVLEPKRLGGETNLTLILHGKEGDQPKVISLVLRILDDKVDITPEIHVSGRSPMASLVPVIFGSSMRGKKELDDVMNRFLSLTPPKKAKEMYTGYEWVRVWMNEGSMYLRSSYDLVSPAPSQIVKGGGVTVFRVSRKVPVIVMDVEGELKTIHIKDKKPENIHVKIPHPPMKGGFRRGES